jgi:hypothetical protein
MRAAIEGPLSLSDPGCSKVQFSAGPDNQERCLVY